MDMDVLMNGAPFTPPLFKQPPREFGIFPFWFVNGEMSYEEMEWQLRQFYDKGIPGIFFHARFGIKEYMPYLGEDWFDRVRFTVEKAKEIGLQVWIYDEYNWPSGTADQQIQADRPELTSTYLELVVCDIKGHFFTFMEGTDSRYNDLEQSEPVYACAIRESDLINKNEAFINLMPSLSFDKVITWEAPEGSWKLLYFIERKASWYTDVLNEETTKEFLKRCHERYLENLGGCLNGKVEGFYTDEPAMFYFESGRDNYIIPWSGKIFRIFREQNGYELRENLPKLFFDVGSDYEQVRYDFYHALSNQYEKAYYKQIADWCEKEGVLFTGHLLYEESLRRQARAEGNLFSHLKHFDLVGVDHLYPRIGTRDMPEEHVAIKIASSAAHQFGSVRLLCESMGGSYWDATMRRMKWIADWEYVLGVNLLNPHGFHYSIEGERKRDWPPSQFYHHTWWEQYKLFNTYISRLSYAMSGGRHVCSVAVLYPMNSIWANYVPQAADRISQLIEKDFNDLTDRLLRLHVEFDYLDEDVLSESGRVSDGKICIRDEQYSCLILPPMTHIKEKTLTIMEQFVEGGGSLIGDALLPTALVEGQAEDMHQRMQKLFNLDPAAIRKAFDLKQEGPCCLSKNRFGKGETYFISGSGLSAEKGADRLCEAVLSCVQPILEIADQDILSLHREKDGQDLFFLINPTSQTRKTDLCIHQRRRPLFYNLETGEINPIPVYKADEKSVAFTVTLPPCGSLLLSTDDQVDAIHLESADFVVTRLTDQRISGYGPSDQCRMVVCNKGKRESYLAMSSQTLPPIHLKGPFEFERQSKNTMLLGDYRFYLLGEPESYSQQLLKQMVKPEYKDDDWLSFTMGAWEMQLPQEREEEIYPVDLLYRARFDADYIPDDLEILIDGFKGIAYKLYINGQLFDGPLYRSDLDAEIKAGNIADYAKPGTNVLAILITVAKKTHGLLDLIKLMGSFSLAGRAADEKEARAQNQTTAYRMVRPNDLVESGWWTENGYPYYSGTGVFRKTFELDEKYKDKVLHLSVDCKEDILEVFVNGEKAGCRLWDPYALDLTPFVKAGRNTIELKITNTLINLLEAVEKPSGFGKAAIEAFNRFDMVLNDPSDMVK